MEDIGKHKFPLSEGQLLCFQGEQYRFPNDAIIAFTLSIPGRMIRSCLACGYTSASQEFL